MPSFTHILIVVMSWCPAADMEPAIVPIVEPVPVKQQSEVRTCPRARPDVIHGVDVDQRDLDRISRIA